MKRQYVFAGLVFVLVAVAGMPYLAGKGTWVAPESASSDKLVLPPPKETFSPIFEPCAHCHQIGPGARNSTGPVLTGVINRAAASTAYPYSSAMRESGLIWDETTLRAFLENPHKLVPGTRMAFAGLGDAQISGLIEFLRTNK